VPNDLRRRMRNGSGNHFAQIGVIDKFSCAARSR
jgi:hypothetical protein